MKPEEQVPKPQEQPNGSRQKSNNPQSKHIKFLYGIIGTLMLVIVGQGGYIYYMHTQIAPSVASIYTQLAESPLLKDLDTSLDSLQGLDQSPYIPDEGTKNSQQQGPNGSPGVQGRSLEETLRQDIDVNRLLDAVEQLSREYEIALDELEMGYGQGLEGLYGPQPQQEQQPENRKTPAPAPPVPTP